MEAIKDKFEDLTENATGILETYYKLTVLNAADKSVSILSMLLVSLSLLAVTMFILLFGGIGLSIYFNGLLQSDVNGYFLVTGIYVVIGIALFLLRKEIIFPFVRNILIKKVYE